MGSELQRLHFRKKILARINEISKQSKHTLIIHYSCENFYDHDDQFSPRITSIAIRNLASGQTNSFSLHQIAEEEHIDFGKISDVYDDLEKSMLDKFYEFVKMHSNFVWIHWNMRDDQYGFPAIEHRYRVLGGHPVQILDEYKFDLSRALIIIYGVGYIKHPRLKSLILKNKITDKDFLSGEDEAKAFKNKQFVKLHQSNLRKVDTLANIFERTSNSTLKTNSSWCEQRGYTFSALIELGCKHWFVTLLMTLGGLLTFIIRISDFCKHVFGGGK